MLVNREHLYGRCLETATPSANEAMNVQSWEKAIPALLHAPLQDLQVCPEPLTSIVEELITALVLH